MLITIIRNHLSISILMLQAPAPILVMEEACVWYISTQTGRLVLLPMQHAAIVIFAYFVVLIVLMIWFLTGRAFPFIALCNWRFDRDLLGSNSEVKMAFKHHNVVTQLEYNISDNNLCGLLVVFRYWYLHSHCRRRITCPTLIHGWQ